MTYYITEVDDKNRRVIADGHHLYTDGNMLVLYKDRKKKEKRRWFADRIIQLREIQEIIILNNVKFVQIEK
jgi:hypothetical protein